MYIYAQSHDVYHIKRNNNSCFNEFINNRGFFFELWICFVKASIICFKKSLMSLFSLVKIIFMGVEYFFNIIFILNSPYQVLYLMLFDEIYHL